MRKITFYWYWKIMYPAMQEGRQKSFVREMLEDKDFPKEGDFADIMQYLVAKNTLGLEIYEFVNCWKFYEEAEEEG